MGNKQSKGKLAKNVNQLTENLPNAVSRQMSNSCRTPSADVHDLVDGVGDQPEWVKQNEETFEDSITSLDTDINYDGSDTNCDEESLFSKGLDKRHNRCAMPHVSQTDASHSGDQCDINNTDLDQSFYEYDELPYYESLFSKGLDKRHNRCAMPHVSHTDASHSDGQCDINNTDLDQSFYYDYDYEDALYLEQQSYSEDDNCLHLCRTPQTDKTPLHPGYDLINDDLPQSSNSHKNHLQSPNAHSANKDYTEIEKYLDPPYVIASSNITEQQPSVSYSDDDIYLHYARIHQTDKKNLHPGYDLINDDLSQSSNSHENHLKPPDAYLPYDYGSFDVYQDLPRTRTQDAQESASCLQEHKSHELSEAMDYAEMVKIYKPLIVYQHLQQTGAHLRKEKLSHELNEEIEYKEMVELNKPLIVANLIVKEILPYLPFIKNHEDLYAVENRSPREAVFCLLDELKSCEEEGKWQKFVEALEHCGYENIVENIKGYICINHYNINQRQYIRKLSGRLIKQIKATELLPRLHAEGLISQNDREEIEREDINCGNIAASTMLLRRIPRKLSSWYAIFIDVLRDEGFPEIAAYLDLPYLVASSKIKEQDSSVGYSDDDNCFHFSRKSQTDKKPLDPWYAEIDDGLLQSSHSHENHLRPPDSDLPHEHGSFEVYQDLPRTRTQYATESTSCTQEPISHELSEAMDYEEMVKIYQPLIVYQHLQQTGAHITKETASCTQEQITHEMNEENEFEEMVVLYKQLIVANLIVREILPYLPFIENPEDLYAVEKRSPQEAVVCLLNELKSCEEEGKWQKFVEALEYCGYEHIVENIKGYICMNHYNLNQQQHMRKLSGKLITRIRARELLPRLYADGLISQNDREEIEREDTNCGNIAASTMLLNRIPRKRSTWYTTFIDVLRDEGFTEIAEYLFIPHLVKQPCVRFSNDDNLSLSVSIPQSDVMNSADDIDLEHADFALHSCLQKNSIPSSDLHYPHTTIPLEEHQHLHQTGTQTAHKRSSCSQEQMSRCVGYEEMVEIFKPLIVANLIVREILPHLPFIEDQEDLYAAEHRSSREAVICLLDKLKSFKEIGKWHRFIDVLRLCGYEYIVKNIKCYKVINHDYQHEFVRSLTGKLSKMIKARDLLTRLHAEGLISKNDIWEIEREITHFGNIAASTLLLSRIPRRRSTWYMTFIDVLRDGGYHKIAEMLDIPHLITLRKIKVSKACVTGNMPRLTPTLPPETGKTEEAALPAPPIPPRIPIKVDRKVLQSYCHETYEDYEQ